jgi:hypothetical protein
MKKIEDIIQTMIERDIFEEFDVCEECNVPDPKRPRFTEDEGCPCEETDACPKEIMWDNYQKVAEAILNLDCVKNNKILFSALNKEIEK